MRVLLIIHETSRTGAPRIGHLIARALVANGHDVEIVARFPGPLLIEFEAIATTSVEFLHRFRRRLRSVRSLRFVAFLLDTWVVSMTIVARRPDVVYVNSAAAAIYLRPARWLRRKVILHVHESAKVVQDFLARAHASTELHTLELVACSPSVQRDLAMLLGHEIEAVRMVPSVPDDSMVASLATEASGFDYRTEELVVGCCGAVERRKGADLWEGIAARVRRDLPGYRVRFVWVGQDDLTVRSPGLGEAEFLGPRANPYAHIRQFDVFALPSRDDPFPLVVLEAMQLGKPVVAFDVGGVSQQVGDAGVVVPPGDIDAFAGHIVRLLKDDHERRRLGDAARSRAISAYSTDAFMAEIGALVPFADATDRQGPTLRAIPERASGRSVGRR